jgi:hypothetical protein
MLSSYRSTVFNLYSPAPTVGEHLLEAVDEDALVANHLGAARRRQVDALTRV